MPPKLHYLLRFLFGLTRWEIYGILSLSILMMAWLVCVWIMDEGIGDSAASDYDMVFLNKVTEVIKVNRSNKVSNSYWRKKSNYWKPAPVTLEGKGLHSKPHSIDINSADSLAWISLKGIGPGFAHRILVFREKLGGFYSVNQLKEVYGLDSTWVNENQNYLNPGKGIFRKFRLNVLDWKDFRHPYISYQQAKIFLKYRAQHGSVKHFDQLKEITLLDINSWERLKPYLDFIEK